MTKEGFSGLKRPLGAIRAIVYGTIVVGTLDILDAIIFFGSLGIKPIRIFHSIAAGLLGRPAAFSGGMKTALLGAFLHYFIAFGIVAVYYFVSLRVDALTRNVLIYGLLYGLVVFGIMSYVVVPLSGAGTGTPHFPLPALLNGLLGHAILIGLPSAIFAKWGQKGLG